MICAYDKLYLEKARSSLGKMLDFAVNQSDYDVDDFFRRFIASGIAARLEHGDPLTQDSELEKVLHAEIDYGMDRSPVYWTG